MVISRCNEPKLHYVFNAVLLNSNTEKKISTFALLALVEYLRKELSERQKVVDLPQFQVDRMTL